MLVPIGHDQSIRRWPYVTIGIIAICTLVQLYAQFVAPTIDDAARALAEHDAERALSLVHQLPAWKWGYHTGSGYKRSARRCASRPCTPSQSPTTLRPLRGRDPRA